MKLTPEVLRAAYEYLSETEPFHSWNMTDGDEIKFEVRKDKKWQGYCKHKYYPHTGETVSFTIQIGEKYVHHTGDLMYIMAHEMVHAHMFHNGIKERSHHGKVFKAFAAEVCTAHGFDPGQF